MLTNRARGLIKACCDVSGAARGRINVYADVSCGARCMLTYPVGLEV